MAADEPPSPTTLALASLNMSRDDLARHTNQMRSFLQTSAPSLHVLQHTTQIAPFTSSSVASYQDTVADRPSLDVVLERSERRRKDTKRDKKFTPLPTSDATSLEDQDPHPSTSSYVLPQPSMPLGADSAIMAEVDASSRPSSACSSLAYQQDVFYSRPTSTAPSVSASQHSLRRSASFSSQASALRDHLDGTSEDLASELDSSMDYSFPPRGIPHSHNGPFLVTSAGSSHDCPPSRSSSSGELLASASSSSLPLLYPRDSLPHLKPGPLPLRTPNKQRPLNALPPQIVIPSASSPVKDFAASSSSPSNDPRTTSQFDPRTPFRPHLMGQVSKGRQTMPISSPAQFSSSPVNEATLPFRLPSGPRLTSKPHYSYAALIGQALMSASTGRLSLNQIYTWISLAYPYFKRGEAGWQNSIRHNLSLNGCFVKIRRDDGEKGKGSWWAIREGDESCFVGGGFQRQGRAGGRKRKGNDPVSAQPQLHGASNPTSVASQAPSGGEDSEEDGGSPKKKRKPSSAGVLRTTPQHNSRSSQLLDSSTHMTSSLSQPLISQASMMVGPPPKATLGTRMQYTRCTPGSYPPPGGVKQDLAHQSGPRVQDHPLALLLAKSGLSGVYPAPVAASTTSYVTAETPMDITSPSNAHQLSHLGPATDFDDSDDDGSERSDVEPPLIPHPSCSDDSSHTFSPSPRNNLSVNPSDIFDDNNSHTSRKTLLKRSTSRSAPSDDGIPLGKPFDVPSDLTSSASTGIIDSAISQNDAQTSGRACSTSSSSSSSAILKPGFSFEPSIAVKEECYTANRNRSEVVVKEEPLPEDDAEYSASRELSKFSNLYADEDHFPSSSEGNLFSSSPISASRSQHQLSSRARSRPSLTPGSSRLKGFGGSSSSRAPPIAGATDLLSRVLESKALRRSTVHGMHPKNPGVFPRPTTPVKDVEPLRSSPSRKDTVFNRPITPHRGSVTEESGSRGRPSRPRTPPPRTTRPLHDRLDEDEEEAMFRKLDKDPQLAAAVSALASLSPNRTPMSHAAFHMSPAAPPPSDLQHYKSSLLPPSSPFRTPARSGTAGRDSSIFTPSGTARVSFDYYDYLGDGTNLAEELDRTFGARYKSNEGGRSAFTPRTPATPITGGLFASANLYQSPSLPSPGWRRF